MNQIKIGYTETVHKILMAYYKDNEELTDEALINLGNAIINIPKGEGLKIDTSDNSISFNNIPLSFIRDWNEKTIYIMTNAEAVALDNNAPLKTFFIPRETI